MSKAPKDRDTGSTITAGLIMLGGFAWMVHSCTMSTPVTNVVLAQTKDTQQTQTLPQNDGVKSPVEEWVAGLDFDTQVGAWHIGGKVLGKGNTVMCRMQREGSMGTQFAYMDGLSAGVDGMATWALFVVGTKIPDGEHPSVTVTFDGIKQKPITGRVDGGYASIDLDKQSIEVITTFVNLVQNSKSLRLKISMPEHLDEITYVDLTDSSSAFNNTGVCLKSMTDMGMARMKTYAK